MLRYYIKYVGLSRMQTPSRPPILATAKVLGPPLPPQWYCLCPPTQIGTHTHGTACVRSVLCLVTSAPSAPPSTASAMAATIHSAPKQWSLSITGSCGRHSTSLAWTSTESPPFVSLSTRPRTSSQAVAKQCGSPPAIPTPLVSPSSSTCLGGRALPASPLTITSSPIEPRPAPELLCSTTK